MRKHLQKSGPVIDYKGYDEDHDQRKLELSAEKKQLQFTKLQALGAKFVQDKASIESKIEELQRANNPDYQEAIHALEKQLATIQQEYEQQVAEIYPEIADDYEMLIEQMNEGAERMEEQAESVRDISMDASSTDTEDAAEALERKKSAFEASRDEHLAKLKPLMEQAAEQQRKMRVRRLRGE